MDDSVQRAPSAPPLPPTPFRFVAYFMARFRWWYVAMIVLETINSTCGILIPYATGQIIKAVTRAQEQSLSLMAHLGGPLWLFVALAIGEVVFSRAGGACQIYVGPRQRQAVTRAMYAYLQHHSHRFLSNDFAGALAHKISETSMGYSQTVDDHLRFLSHADRLRHRHFHARPCAPGSCRVRRYLGGLFRCGFILARHPHPSVRGGGFGG